jgi:acyl-CoA hydrolase
MSENVHSSMASTLADSRTEMSEILMPDDTNNLGRALGGRTLHWMDICGAITARRFSQRQVVTASMDHVDFIAPIELGDIVAVTGYVFDTGQTSIDVKTEVTAERPRTGERREAASSFFTFVALDEDEQPATVPELHCLTDTEKQLREGALETRRQRRLELAEKEQSQH